MVKNLFSAIDQKFRKASSTLLLFVLPLFFQAQPPFLRTYNYIDNYSRLAQEQMFEYNIPASVILAQAVLESGSGTSDLALRSNNHFGIKCHTWEGDTVLKDDDTDQECFRRYPSIEDSYTDHSLFLKSRQRYSKLFNLSISDYTSWCYGLKNAGYATSPTYAEELIKLIQEKRLFELDAPEVLPCRQLTVKSEPQVIKKTESKSLRPSLMEFALRDFLFTDVCDILVQSLQMLGPQAEEQIILADK